MSSVDCPSILEDDNRPFNELIADSLAATNWAVSYSERGQKTYISFIAIVSDVNFPVELTCDNAKREVTGHVRYCTTCPKARISKAVKFASLTNRKLSSGGIYVSEDGTVTFADTLSMFGHPVTSALIDRFILNLIKHAAAVNDGVISIVNGDTPEDAAIFV